MKVKYPEHNKSLLSLTSSVLKHFGAESSHQSYPYVDKLLSKNFKNVVIMLFDGLGTSILEKHLPKDSFLRRHFAESFSSVFPATTTAATLSMETGLSPAEHGWLGWSLYFHQIDKTVDIFSNTVSGSNGEQATQYHVARKFLPYKSIFAKIREATDNEVLAICVSPYSSYKSKSVNQICTTVADLCRQPGKKYIYTYWYQPDYDMHDLGTTHSKITRCIKNIDNKLQHLCSGAEDTLFIITADHGLVDTEWIFISDYPDLCQCLLRKPCIEIRALTFYIKKGMKETFEKLFNKYFGNHYILLTKEQVKEKQLFGEGKAHPLFEEFLGDYLAIATGNVSIDMAPRPDNPMFKAMHAGITSEEMEIPLIVVNKSIGL